ncbi:MAG: type II secretion system major pseudopilin GspG [Phycisphaerae bacterium]|nr:type II secretion system major pseudopilin GspG [Phycisphaerae bacterium]
MCSDSNSPRRAAAARGFSLLEIMIVLVIIGLLAGAVTLYASGYLNKSKQMTARREIAAITQAVESFNAVNGRYPTNEEGLDVLAQPSEKFPDPLLKGEPKDPWGNRYQYNAPGSKGPFEVICYGADGREGGDAWNSDITSDALKE